MALSTERVKQLASRYLEGEFKSIVEYTEMVVRESDDAGNPLFRTCKCVDAPTQGNLEL